MAFLINQIREQKILEMEVSVDEFLKEHNISDTAIIHTMIFDKEVFSEEKEVREYLKDKYMWQDNIIEEGDSFIASLISESQISKGTEVSVELRRGVQALAGDLVPVINEREIEFNSKGAISFVQKVDSINFNNGLPHVIEVAKVAKGYHPRYGEIEVTEDHLKSFVKNFNSGVTGLDLAVNEDHEKKEAFGWYKDVWLSHDGQTAFASIQWNNKGTSALSEKDYRYFSPEFHFNYVHEHTGVEHGPTLLGGALTNYPFLKMNAIVDLNNKNKLTKEQIVTKEQIDLSIHTEKVVELNGKIGNLEVQLNAKIDENKTLSDKVKELESTIELNTKKVAHQKLFDQGLINKAMLDAMNEGKSQLEVLALNSKMNVEATGGNANPENTTIELSTTDKKIAKQLGLTDEEYKASNL